MPTEVKVFFSALVIIAGVWVWFFPTKVVPYRASFWKGGAKDGVRNAIFKTDGTPRKYFRHFSILWFTIFTLLIWFVG